MNARVALLIGLVLMTGVTGRAASPFAGTFRGKDYIIRILEVGGGQFQGEIIAGGEPLAFQAKETSGRLKGTLNVQDDKVDFQITVKGAALTFTLDDETTVLTKEPPPAAPAASQGTEGAPGSRSSSASTALEPSASLRVNGGVIDEGKRQQFEKEQRVKLPRGDFWYDKFSGAWGVAGGPTLGFTKPGANLGGPLPVNASRGDTGVYLNGRELGREELAGLEQAKVPIATGRWWVNSRGGIGREGSSTVLDNLLSPPKGSACQKAPAAGYPGGEGQSTYFFDPKFGSGIVNGQ